MLPYIWNIFNYDTHKNDVTLSESIHVSKELCEAWMDIKNDYNKLTSSYLYTMYSNQNIYNEFKNIMDNQYIPLLQKIKKIFSEIKVLYHKVDAIVLAKLSQNDKQFVDNYAALDFKNSKSLFINIIHDATKIRILSLEDKNESDTIKKDRVIFMSSNKSPFRIDINDKTYNLWDLHGTKQCELAYVNRIINYHINKFSKIIDEENKKI